MPVHLNIGVTELAPECGMRDGDGSAATPQLFELPLEREQKGGSGKGPRAEQSRGRLLGTAQDRHLRGLWLAPEVGATVGQTGLHKPHAKMISAASRNSIHVVCGADSRLSCILWNLCFCLHMFMFVNSYLSTQGCFQHKWEHYEMMKRFHDTKG